jgi:hypothetical protein
VRVSGELSTKSRQVAGFSRCSVSGRSHASSSPGPPPRANTRASPRQAAGNVIGRPRKIQVGVDGNEAHDYEMEYFPYGRQRPPGARRRPPARSTS